MGRRNIEYKPSGPVCGAFLRDESFVRGLRGPIGSGKSVACCVEMWRRANMQKPGADGVKRTRWAVIRNTYPELKITTIKTWHDWFPADLGHWQSQGPPIHHIKNGALDMEVVFLALDSPDDVKKVLSLELTGAWINEAREVPKSVLDALTGRVGRYPAARDGGCSWSGILLDTNPPDSDHWWYKLAELDTPDEFRFFSQPGGLDPAAENLDNLHPKYYQRTALGKDPDWVKVYINGEYGFVTDGKPVYSEYLDRTHCKAVSYTDGLPLFIGIDFGLTPAAVMGQRLVNGQIRCLSEVVTEDMGVERFSEILHRHLSDKYPHHVELQVYGDPAGVARSQTDERTVFDILRKNGFNAAPAETNDFRMRRDSFGTPMTRMIDGEPGFLIDPACRQLRKGLQGGYSYKRLRVSGSEHFKDKPDKGKYSHVCDAGQYMTLGMGEGVKLIQSERRYTQPQRMAVRDYDPFSY